MHPADIRNCGVGARSGERSESNIALNARTGSAHLSVAFAGNPKVGTGRTYRGHRIGAADLAEHRILSRRERELPPMAEPPLHPSTLMFIGRPAD
jgi:hypothetical protein